MTAIVVASLSGSAFAHDIGRTGPVDAITWARPFVLAAPEEDPTAYPRGPTFTEGWLVELRVDPLLLIPSQVNEPWLYVGETPAMKLNWDWEGGCLVAIVPARPDLATTTFVMGAPPSAGSDAATRQRLARAEASRLASAPLPRTMVDAAMAAGGPSLAASDLRDVRAAGMERVAVCTSTDADRQRAGVPGR
jgi:hypothetical protein